LIELKTEQSLDAFGHLFAKSRAVSASDISFFPRAAPQKGDDFGATSIVSRAAGQIENRLDHPF